MKINNDIRQKYLEQQDKYKKIEKIVEYKLTQLKKSHWHFVGRIKTLESMYQKLESGRYESIEKLDDGYACTYVVANVLEIEEASKIVKNNYDVSLIKPDADLVHYDPELFSYNYLRMYPIISLETENIMFEIQIKTYMQHAWSMATHEMIYKPKKKEWRQSRVAHQIKAIIENIDNALVYDYDLETLAMPRDSYKTHRINEIIDLLENMWSEESLPNNRVRMAENILNVLECVVRNRNGYRIYLEKLLTKEEENGRGTKMYNMNPYEVILTGIMHNDYEDFRRGCERRGRRVLLTKSVIIPEEKRWPEELRITL